MTQNTNWGNVWRAIENLKKEKLLSATKLYRLPNASLAQLIRPAGYYNIKAKRLKNFLEFLFNEYGGNLKKLGRHRKDVLRRKLLSVNGIGEETADSIILYAFNKPVFVIDAYTKRILARHHLVDKDVSYLQAQKLFMDNLDHNAKLFNEYHALLVKTGKDFCRKNRPRCHSCPLKKI